MKNERAEEIIRHKITGSETIEDDVSIDATTLWARLDRANEPTGKKKNLTFYWAAAAIILVIVSVIALLPKQGTEEKILVVQQPITPIHEDRKFAEKPMAEPVKNPPVAATPAAKPKATHKAYTAEDIEITPEDLYPPGMYAMPVAAMVCYNTNIEDNLLID